MEPKVTFLLICLLTIACAKEEKGKIQQIKKCVSVYFQDLDNVLGDKSTNTCKSTPETDCFEKEEVGMDDDKYVSRTLQMKYNKDDPKHVPEIIYEEHITTGKDLTAQQKERAHFAVKQFIDNCRKAFDEFSKFDNFDKDQDPAKVIFPEKAV